MVDVQGVVTPKHLVNGEWIAGSGDTRFEVFDPATGQAVAELQSASSAEVDAAVEGAAAAFEEWSALSMQRRVQYLYRMRQSLQDNSERLAQTLSLDHGKTLDEARGEVMRAGGYLETALAAPMLSHSKSGDVAAGVEARHVREPLGVCLAVTPSNFPVMNPAMFTGWALAMGNTLIIKPSEQDPMATTALVALFQECGLPKGVLSLVHGTAETTKQLIAHPKVVAVSCITSSPTAKAISEQAGLAGKRVQANGGAKNPIVVAADADLGLAARGIVESAFGMAGQRCLAGTRIIVDDAIHDQLVEQVAQLSDEIVVGAGRDEGVTMGPVVTAASKARLVAALEQAEAAGATLVRDGRKVTVKPGTATEAGYFFGPTIITGLDASHPTDCQELFGPVIVVHRATSLEDAIALANDTEFGNAATLFTRSGAAARAFERGVRSGNIGINSFPAPPADLTMGGLGTSFYGQTHVGGDSYVRFYSEEKLVVSRW
ncbi:aldehyde dehydrogenase family protein [Mycolicibacterium litorale]|uniref:aldehyde dehydrogenase family protein n=1 Tax=Mycolicibacterium litorale TaxID=758802 RepID=UPI003CF798B3